MKEATYYGEAMRYIDNAKTILAEKTTIAGGLYDDEKYVKTAAGAAYAGLEKAARWYLKLNGYKKTLGNNKAIVEGLSSVNGKAKDYFNEAYGILHVDAYYQDMKGVDTIKAGFKYATLFINLLKPYNGTMLPEDSGGVGTGKLLRRRK